jgi:D-Tyr-tRNAtyr deacylase
MHKDRAKTLLLLDLSTFALIQDNHEGTRKDFDMACKMAEKHSLPQLQMYKDFIARVKEDESNTRY